jgi:hypothetical protein
MAQQGSTEMKLMSYDPMDKLTDDTLVDIISCVPYKSTCSCKCVSTRWRDLFSHPDHRKKLPCSHPLLASGSSHPFPPISMCLSS